MSKETRQEAPAVASAFLQRYLEDFERGAVKPLEDYLGMYPGYEEVVVREYARLGKEATLPPRSIPLSASDPITSSVLEIRSTAGEEPRQIGVYKIFEVLGQGGMGVVYVAEQTEPIRRRVALKVIKLGMDTREVLARFEAERQALAMMNHPHIARVYDAGATAQGRPYFVMEYVPGIPFTRFCDQHQLTTRQRLEIFLQICDAVQHAHQKGIIHRDLKPSNVLVAYEDSKAVAKIIDFGVAKSTNQRLTEQTIFTEQGQIIGTPEYMSPEQAEMSALDVDTRTDIYSLGVMLYELLTGVLPFESKELRELAYFEIQRRIREVDPPTPSTRLSRLGAGASDAAEKRRSDVKSLVRQLRGDLDWITMKAMEKDRSRRYPSASELAADVLRSLRHEPVLARPPSVTYRLRKLASRYRAALGAIAGVLIVLAGAWGASRYVGAKRLHAEGLASLEKHRALKGDLVVLEEDWKKARKSLESWRPVWERGEELAAWRRLEESRAQIGVHLDHAVMSLQRGLDKALPWSPDRRRIQEALEGLYFERYLEVLGGGTQPRPEFFRMMVQSLGVGTYRRRLEEGKVAFTSEPPGADIYCFRYEEIECRLVPLPFDPGRGRSEPGKGQHGKGISGKPFLEVEAVIDTALSPFAPRDRILEVAGRPVATWSDFAGALEAVSLDQQVEVKLLRSGAEVRAAWVPFPQAKYQDSASPLKPGRVLSIRDQFGILLAGYPLEFVEGARIGVTSAGAPVEVELPRGSYLFVFRKAGHPDVRYPIAVPSEEEVTRLEAEHVKLPREDDVPPGFVYIPAGPVCAGGDGEVDQDLPRATHRVGGFFMSRLEVTVGDYLRFVNSKEVFDGTLDEKGLAPASRSKPLRLIPVDTVGLIFDLDESARAWRIGPRLLYEKKEPKKEAASKNGVDDPQWLPILGVSNQAARLYADWLTREKGGRWRFRLPSDLEWEKAARGVDRRFYVWGNYVVWSFCRSLGGSHLASRPERAGTYPIDESVFGVRDMAGSVCEPTTGQTIPNYTSLRGGSWDEPTPYYYRIANRLGRRLARGRDQGIRIVADLPAP